jgi:hypothetical protein
MNEQQTILVSRLKEADLNLNRFFAVLPDKSPAELKGYTKNLKTPEEMDKLEIIRWGIMGRDFLVLIDSDDPRMYEAISKVLPPTFEVTSPRRGLPHKYFIVPGKRDLEVQNGHLHIEGVLDADGKLKSLGEIRAQNNYLVAPGTEIDYTDLTTKEQKNGMYLVTKDIPLARVEYDDFMEAVKPFFGSVAKQRVTKDHMENGIAEGERHTILFQEACSLASFRKDGEYFSRQYILDALTVSAYRCNPPFDDNEELSRMVDNAIGYRPTWAKKKQEAEAAKIFFIKVGTPTTKTLEERFNEFIKAKENTDFKTVYEGDYKKCFGRRKKADAYMVWALLKAGFNVGETRQLMDGSKNTDWNNKIGSDEDKDEYQDETIEAAQESLNTVMERPAKVSQADRLVQLCEVEKVELFHDQHNSAFAHFCMPCGNCDTCDKNDSCGLLSSSTHTKLAKNDKEKTTKGEEEQDKRLQQPQISQKTAISQVKNVTYQLNSNHFKSWLALLMWKHEQKTPGGDAISSALNVLRGKAVLEGKQHELYNRIAPASDGFYIDMADGRGRAIKVTAEGWSIAENPPILFKRYSHQKPLVTPLPMSETEAAKTALKFLEYVNVNKNDKDTQLALLITVISYFIPLIAHPAIVVNGSQGTAKSYLFKLIRRIVDPSSLELLTLNRDQKELTQSLDHNWCCFFDNVSYLSGESSDTLCRAITGGGNSKRELWTNDDDVIYSFKRCIGVNGINIAAQRGDLLDRSLLVGLVRITSRKTEEDLDKDFAKDLPAILGAFLTILSKALKNYPTIQPKQYFRLADWTRYACAIAEALGKTQKDFMDAYSGKVQLQNEEAINASPLATVLLDYCKKELKKPQLLTSTWEGTATTLLNELTIHAEQMGINTRDKEKWPSAANALSRALNRVSDALQTVGCIVTMKEGTPRKIIIDAENVNIEDNKETLETKLKQVWDKIEKCHVKWKISWDSNGSVLYVPIVPVQKSKIEESEVSNYSQLVCYWCKKPLDGMDWEDGDNFTEGKPAHKKCNAEHKALLKLVVQSPPEMASFEDKAEPPMEASQ